MESLEKWQPGTGQWFLDSPEFVAWVNGHNPALICFGIPGAGKTILASVAINHLRSTLNGRGLPVAFLYCNYKMQEKQSGKNLLAMLLRQLVGQCASVPESVKALYASRKRNETGPSFPEISDALSKVVGSQDRTFLVLDALDECSDEARKTLLTKLQELRQNTKTSVMATSRHHSSLEREFEGDARLEIRAVERDIDLYLGGQLKGLSECIAGNDALQKTIKECIAQAAGGM
jgi:Cdc6-like AAA superfamily ATPase